MKKYIIIGAGLAVSTFLFFRIREANAEMNKAITQIKKQLDKAYTKVLHNPNYDSESITAVTALMVSELTGMWEDGLSLNGIRMGNARIETLIVAFLLTKVKPV